MCATTALLETGMIPMVEPESVVIFDTAAGLVKATATCEGGKVVKVTLDMPPSFMAKAGVIETPEWGPVRYDLCFGGVFYALVDVDQIGLTIAPENARALAMAGVESVIPADEVIDAMRSIGRSMNEDIRETGKGGLAGTPTGVEIRDRMAGTL